MKKENLEMTNLSAKDRKNANFQKLNKKLHQNVGQAIADFNMIENGDKIMVCISGGKDSYTLLDILISLRKKAPINFEIVAVNLDQKQPGFPEATLPQYLKSIGVTFEIIEEDTYSIVKDKIPEGKTTCSLCSRLRRGIIYNWAEKNKITKIALGHHRDDMVETLFLNMFFGGKLKSMPAKLKSDDGRNTVIRPLAYAKENDIEKFSKLKNFPIIPCNLCGSQENLQRKQVKKMLQQWEEQYPNRIQTIFRSMSNVAPSHLLDRELFAFENWNSNSEHKDEDSDNKDSELLFDAPSFEKPKLSQSDTRDIKITQL